ncbi:hypothetical protein CFter6_1483 [Collimonas fungivorans]|uniref:Uncharacterized protein n=1 Tax=Collimonas fungivorans TaxID=158899 RepID=A0A127P8U7_9BURK|nr:hypothetical protein CFter6_1483 [Collimonas fungivorans]
METARRQAVAGYKRSIRTWQAHEDNQRIEYETEFEASTYE